MSNGTLQLPAKRVIEGTVVEPLRITIEVDASGLKNLLVKLREVSALLSQTARATAFVRPTFHFEKLDDGAIETEYCKV